MKKLLRVKMFDRHGVCGSFKETTYVVNRKFCERMNIEFTEDNDVLKERVIKKLQSYGVSKFEVN